ncbi:MAG: pteridine reductase [Gammaproteobacteria bacterium]|nr:pteridine reductase [Gammaproteobacteria bacterium]
MCNKVALITGGARRIGAAIARDLHSQGMNIALHYRSSADAAQQLRDELTNKREDSVVLIQAELLECEGLPKLVDDAQSAWGRIDALVNNASSFYPTPLGSITQQHWDELMGSNLKAALFLSQSAAPHLAKKHGCIVNIIDIHSERPLKAHTVYCVAKAGLTMLTKSLAKELGPEVRVNGIAPGSILWPEQEMSESSKEEITSRTTLKRQGTPEEIACGVRFLVKDATFVTGQILAMDGGRTLSN